MPGEIRIPAWVRALKGENVPRGKIDEYIAETIAPDENGKHPRQVLHIAEGESPPPPGVWLQSLGPGWRLVTIR